MNYDPVKRFFTGRKFEKTSISTTNLKNSHLKKVNMWVNDTKDFFVYEGDPGVGKTHFMLSLAEFIFDKEKKSCPFPSVFCYPESKIFEIISSAWKTSGTTEKDEIRKITDAKYLFIDDLGASTAHEWHKTLLFTIMDERWKEGKKTFITTNLSSDEIIAIYGPRFEDRIHNKNTYWIKKHEESLRKN